MLKKTSVPNKIELILDGKGNFRAVCEVSQRLEFSGKTKDLVGATETMRKFCKLLDDMVEEVAEQFIKRAEDDIKKGNNKGVEKLEN